MTHNPDPVAELLRAAGPRAHVPADRAGRVEEAVRLEWQQTVQARLGRKRAIWIAASCLTSAALIALVLHAHVGPASSDSTVAPQRRPVPIYETRGATPLGSGSYFRANNEERTPDRGMPRQVFASYTVETR